MGPPPGMDWSGVRAMERRGLRAMRIAAIIGLIGSIITFVGVFVVPPLVGSPSVFSGPTNLPANGSFNSTAFNNSTFLHGLSKYFGSITIVVVVGVLVAIVSTLYYRQSFSDLRPLDRRLGSASGFAIVLVIGAIFSILAFLLLYVGLSHLAGCYTSSNTLKSGCVGSLVGYLGGGAGLLLLAGILLLIGVIGVAIGIWRVGTRYNSTLLHVGSILFIFLGFVGAILIIVGTSSIDDQLANAPPGPPPTSYGYAPPGYPPPGYPPPR